MECVSHVGKQLYADPEAREQWISLIEKHNFAIYEAQMRRKDGSTCWVRQRAQAVRDLEGNTIYYEGFTEDITEQKQAQEELKQYRDNLEALVEERTKQLEEKNRLLISEIAERKKAEEALRESENTYRTIFENTGNATLFYGEDALITLVNNEYLKMFQFTREEVEGKKRWVDLVLKEDLEWLTEYHRLRGIDSKAVPRNYELRVVDRYGNIKNVYMTIAMIPGTQKRVASILYITPLKEAEKELKKYLEEISDLYENAPCGYHSLGADGTFIRINKTELAWLGYAREEIIGKMKLPDLLTKKKGRRSGRNFLYLRRGDGQVTKNTI
jgi:PAS domain S-box-containing protein